MMGHSPPIFDFRSGDPLDWGLGLILIIASVGLVVNLILWFMSL